MTPTLIAALLQAVIQLAPEITALVPIVEKLFQGQTLTSADNATAWAAIVQLENLSAAKEQAALASTSAAATVAPVVNNTGTAA